MADRIGNWTYSPGHNKWYRQDLRNGEWVTVWDDADVGVAATRHDSASYEHPANNNAAILDPNATPTQSSVGLNDWSHQQPFGGTQFTAATESRSGVPTTNPSSPYEMGHAYPNAAGYSHPHPAQSSSHMPQASHQSGYQEYYAQGPKIGADKGVGRLVKGGWGEDATAINFEELDYKHVNSL
ncbi:hypothetical protein BDV95DRAFT_160603 [Massariosphaeria phaeospora]|uniref:Uncharacterized protein n=1 Tax=Massariosphaeria phaeospora TaxID=100035 RepID=A0A7C8I925_9PLEO|nr:hypothetical protein BDV95DRAFT_160603 [Massariosphaeria phaeospora]